jgi:hypothetical protein
MCFTVFGDRVTVRRLAGLEPFGFGRGWPRVTNERSAWGANSCARNRATSAVVMLATGVDPNTGPM